MKLIKEIFNNNNYMLDVETLGRNASAPILSIALVPFNIEGEQIESLGAINKISGGI